jgi:hypothetical protein
MKIRGTRNGRRRMFQERIEDQIKDFSSCFGNNLETRSLVQNPCAKSRHGKKISSSFLKQSPSAEEHSCF